MQGLINRYIIFFVLIIAQTNLSAQAELLTDAVWNTEEEYSYLIDYEPDQFRFLKQVDGSGSWDFLLNDLDDIMISRPTRSESSVFSAQIPVYGECELFYDQNVLWIQRMKMPNLYGMETDQFFKLTKPIPLNAELGKLGASHILKTNLVVALDGQSLSESFVEDLPTKPDSIKIVFEYEIFDVPYDRGKVNLKGTQLEVNRIERSISIKPRIEIKISTFEWNDITGFLNSNYITQVRDERQILAFSQEFPLPVIAATIRDGEYSAVYFLGKDKVRNKNSIIGKGSALITAKPNPVINDVSFIVSNLTSGNYQIRIKNILGKIILQKAFIYNIPKEVPVDLSSLSKGSYFYSLVNEDGKVVITKRLIIIRP